MGLSLALRDVLPVALFIVGVVLLRRALKKGPSTEELARGQHWRFVYLLGAYFLCILACLFASDFICGYGGWHPLRAMWELLVEFLCALGAVSQ